MEQIKPEKKLFPQQDIFFPDYKLLLKMQLVDESITLVDTMKEAISDIAGVKERFGIPPELIIDYLTLIGDTSDNVPGVPKVGPKTAVKWLQQYGSLDGVITHAAEIGGKVGENLRESLHFLPLSRQLVTIKTDVPLEYKPHELRRVAPDRETLKSMYSHLEFKSWLAELLQGGESAEMPQLCVFEQSYEMVTTIEQLDVWLRCLELAELFALRHRNDQPRLYAGTHRWRLLLGVEGSDEKYH